MLWFHDPACRDNSLVGNKGSWLARLSQRGFDVPPGFCLTIEALQRPLDQWASAMEAALAELPPPWAVRSSSTAEDSKGAAFPGLFTTVLDVGDRSSAIEAAVLIATRRNDESVVRYAESRGIGSETIRMGVIVQTMVPADSAGVAFSRDPISGAEVVCVEANYGLGETVVDGSVTPDEYCVDTEDRIVQRRIGSKKEKVVTTTSGTRLRRLPTSARERAKCVLNDDQVLLVAGLARRLDQETRQAIDLEWAFVDGRLALLQARPITTLPTSTNLESH
ncbi:hypothetical protein OJ998_10820 [Solirubrobacter taibaiensis]|nr:hypothetical protein [Solirubrobacter taibaiensis]